MIHSFLKASRSYSLIKEDPRGLGYMLETLPTFWIMPKLRPKSGNEISIQFIFYTVQYYDRDQNKQVNLYFKTMFWIMPKH